MPPARYTAPYLLTPGQDNLPGGLFCLPVYTTAERLQKMLTALDFARNTAAYYGDRDHMIDVLEALAHVNECGAGECEECETCVDHAPDEGFIGYAPNDPFRTPNSVPPGYVLPAWYNNPTIPIPGVQPGDAMVNFASLPIFANLPDILASGLPRMFFNTYGASQVEIEFVKVPNGGLAWVTIDGSPIGGQIIELDSTTVIDFVEINELFDILLGGGIVQTEIIELNFPDHTPHDIQVSFIPNVGTDILLGFGGGIRSIELCGVTSEPEEIPPMFELVDCHLMWRPNSSAQWVDLGYVCGEPGEDGLTPEIRMDTVDANTQAVQWKYTNEPDNIPGIWRNAGFVDDGAPGAPGADGAQGEKGDKGDKGDPGENGICEDCGEAGFITQCDLAGGIIGQLYDALGYFFAVWQQDYPTHDLLTPSTFDHTINSFPLGWTDTTAVRNAMIDFYNNRPLYGSTTSTALDAMLYAVGEDITQPDVRCYLAAHLTGQAMTTPVINDLVLQLASWVGGYAVHMDKVAEFAALIPLGAWGAMVNTTLNNPIAYDCTACRTYFCRDTVAFAGVYDFSGTTGYTITTGARTGTGAGAYIASRLNAVSGTQIAGVRFVTGTPGRVNRVQGHYSSLVSYCALLVYGLRAGEVVATYVAQGQAAQGSNIAFDTVIDGFPECVDELLFYVDSGDTGNVGNSNLRLLDITIS